jgi:hypothetical protein
MRRRVHALSDDGRPCDVLLLPEWRALPGFAYRRRLSRVLLRSLCRRRPELSRLPLHLSLSYCRSFPNRVTGIFLPSAICSIVSRIFTISATGGSFS